MVSGSDSRSEPSQLSDRDLVESVLRDLSEAADKWEALVTQAETVTYSVDWETFALLPIRTGGCSS